MRAAVLHETASIDSEPLVLDEIPEPDYERSVFYERNIDSVTSNTRQDERETLAKAVSTRAA